MYKNRYRNLLKPLTTLEAKVLDCTSAHNWPKEWGYCHRCDIAYLEIHHDRCRLKQQDDCGNQLCERIDPSGPRITLANATKEQVVNALHKAAKIRRAR